MKIRRLEYNSYVKVRELMIEVLFLGKKETVDNSFEDVEFRDLTFWGGYEGWNGKVMSKCKVNTNRLK